MSELESLKAEYILLLQEGATEASWEEYREDFLVVKHRQQDLYHQTKMDDFNTTRNGEWRMICWSVAVINGLCTLACPLYAPVGVASQVLMFNMIKH